MPDPTKRVIDHARENAGLITTREIHELGMGGATLARRVKSGVFTRVAQGIYSLPGVVDRHRLDLEAACSRLGAIVSHESAGRIHRFEAIPLGRPTVTVPHRRTHTFPDVTVHQSTDLEPAHIVSIDGLSVTNPERTVIDLAAVLSQARFDQLVDRALASGKVHLHDLDTMFMTITRRGKPGTARIRRLLEARSGEFVATESELERRLLQLIVGAGLPEPTVQFTSPWLEKTKGRVDLAYVDHQLIIEGDSRKWHLLAKAFQTDRERDRAAQLAGWRILRYTWDEIVNDPLHVVAEIREALGQPISS
jgi:very-short-patch-repair endonuclease